jgi:hypothetical protein
MSNETKEYIPAIRSWFSVRSTVSWKRSAKHYLEEATVHISYPQLEPTQELQQTNLPRK